MDNLYLIPANSKKSMLILGLFNKFDLILFCSGITATLLMFMILPVENIVWALVSIAPGCICAFLVMPVPNYHNVLTFLMSLIEYFTTRQKFIWKGWCIADGKDNEK